MAHTNETSYLHLSQFVGTDIPNPLTDYNGDMEKIDAAVSEIAGAEGGFATDIAALQTQNGSEALTTVAQTLSGAVNELDADTADLQSRMTIAEGKIVADESTLATAVTNVATLAGKVSSLEVQAGNEVLHTASATLSGAINELKAELDGTAGGAAGISERVTELEGDVADLQSAVGTAISGILAAGATSINFTVPTTGDNLIEFYTSDGSNYSAIDTSVAGTVTLTFEADAQNDRVVTCVVKGA